MRIVTDIQAMKLKTAVAEGAEFAVYLGRIIGEEEAHLPDWRDNAWALKHGADIAIEQAAAAAGHSEFDADPIHIDVVLISIEGVEIAGKAWIDRREVG